MQFCAPLSLASLSQLNHNETDCRVNIYVYSIYITNDIGGETFFFNEIIN